MYRTTAGRALDPNVDNSNKPQMFIVRPRGEPLKHLPEKTYAVPSDACSELYLRIAAKSRTPVNRLRITKGSDGSHVPNAKDLTVEQMGLYEASTIFVKDLGPQVAWRTVFLIEYIGPILIHPLIFFLRPFIYHSHQPATLPMYLSLIFIVLHFAKREYETLYVHRFSSATMPQFNILKNSAHYWLLAGFNIALCTYSTAATCPTNHPPSYIPALWNIIATVLFVVGELGNFSVHLTLRDLRSQGGTERGIPTSPLFKLVPVTCPNYFFETVAWVGIWMANRSLSTGLFVLVAVGQMVVWARKKEARYRREFGTQYRFKRFSMLPGII